ncbi:winged helix-turn-helix domain-containing protein [Bacillus pseudomycoides]|uniref:winged helix-turn-helix domain-containing protein n=1 Tax=Bacillus pseudomycoides TaxID=64104 RepID=UPI000BF9DC7C|nr:winged helix-turn-helix domain-containing protein [Bacillus pseudomycoides]PGD77082.1 winged helix-turn-helix domain-containing protein [Bacillus pseudomycoides]
MDTTWEAYLKWRGNKGFTGISTQVQYEQFLTECKPPKETEKLTKADADEMKKIMKDVLATSQEQATFDAFKDNLHQGLTISYDELADLTGTPVRTLKRHIEALTHKGYLHILRGKTKNTYYYGVNMKSTEKKVLPKAMIEWDFTSIAERMDVDEKVMAVCELNDVYTTSKSRNTQYMNIFVTYDTHENAMKEVIAV